MKSHQVILLLLLSVLTFSCTNDLTNYGSEIRPETDEISVGTDTFHLSTENIFVDFMYSKPDSFLLGTFYNEKFGSTRADILAQVNCPEDFKFPDSAVPDSARLILMYNSWFGDQYAPLDVNVYEMNLSTFDYDGVYSTNLDPLKYTDLSMLLGRRIVTAKDAVNPSSGTSAIEVKLSDAFVNRIFDNAEYFARDSVFTKFFKGIYVTANYGASTILNVGKRMMYINYYYHYTYKKPGADTVTVVNNVLTFPANDEVRQVNRFLHPDREAMVKQRDSVNYVASPANLQTRINLPLKRMKDSIDAKIAVGKKQILNNAILKVEATELADATLEMPVVRYMLLIKESEVKDFFENNLIPTGKDTKALLGQISATQIGITGKYEYSYSFDVAALIANELKIAKENNTAPADNLKMVLMPVSVTQTTTSSSTTITAVKQQYLMSGVTIRSGQNEKHPMKLNLVYSGF